MSVISTRMAQAHFLNDQAETRAVKAAFGELAYKTPDLIHQIHDRAHDGRNRRIGSHLLCAGDT